MADHKTTVPQAREGWSSLSAQQQATAEGVFAMWARLLDVRRRASASLESAIAFCECTEDPDLRELAEAEVESCMERVDMLDLLANRAGAMNEAIHADLQWINERRNRVKAVAVFQHAIVQLSRQGMHVDGIQGVWRTQCAAATMPMPKAQLSDREVELGFARFKEALFSAQAQEALGATNSPRAGAVAAVAYAHDVPIAKVRSQLRKLNAQGDAAGGNGMGRG